MPFSLSVVAMAIVLVITLILVVKKGAIHLPKSWVVTRCLTPALFAFAWMLYFVEVRLVEEASTNTARLALDGLFLVLLGVHGLVTFLLSLWAKRRLVASRASKLAQSTRQQKVPLQLVSIKIKEVTPRGTDTLELKSILREPESMSDIHQTISESAVAIGNGKGDGIEDVINARSVEDTDGVKELSKDVHALSPPTSTSAVTSGSSCGASSDSISLTK